jgi:predicted component of type VI protein secretion system
VDVVLNVRSKADNSVKESKLALTGRLLVGRGPDCVVLLDGQGISREHLAVEGDDSSIFIMDTSSNGTWVNGKRLPQNGRSKVAQGDLIEVPGYELRIQAAGTPTQQAPASIRQDAPLPPAAPASSSSSLTWLDKFTILTALVSVALLLLYIIPKS